MLLSEAELERMHRRFPYPRFSKGEYERRYNNIRNLMRHLNLECLLIIGCSAAYGRCWFNFRYVTNMVGKAEMANYCFFPKEGDPAVGANPRHEPQIGFDRVQSAEDRYLFGADGRLVYQAGHVFALQMHIVDTRHTRGLFLADFFVIEENGARCLNKFPPELVRVRN